MAHEKLAEHRRAWQRKPALRRAYQRYHQMILDRAGTAEPIVELGCGAGFFKDSYPQIIATDIEASPWTDQVADCTSMPFDDASVGALVAVDVFHHLAGPAAFLAEAARVLQPGGRLVMLEPWTSPVGYRFYRHVHHEQADFAIDPAQPFSGDKDAFDGNAVLPRMYFDDTLRPVEPFARLPEQLHLCSIELLPGFAWLSTGGFQAYQLLPNVLMPLADLVERILKPLGPWIALRALITIERPVVTQPNSADQPNMRQALYPMAL